MENTNNNPTNFHSDLERLKLKNKLHGEDLKMKCKDQKQIYDNFSKDLNDKDWKKCLSNFEELNNNSKDMRQMMKTQNEIVQDTFKLTEQIITSLEDSSKNNQILRYSDWVAKLIDIIIVPELGRDAWSKISGAYTRNMLKKNDDFLLDDDEEEECFEKLDKILDKFGMTIEEFDKLIELNRMRNTEFHINNQSPGEAKKQLEMSFPKRYECFKEPLKKALDAIESQLNKPNKRKRNKRRSKQN